MNERGIVHISGVSESRVAPVIARIIEDRDSQGLVIVSSSIRARRLAEDLSFFIKNNIYVVPLEEEGFIRYEAKNHDMLFERIKAQKALRTGEKCIVIAPVSAAIKKITPHSVFEENSVRLMRGETIDIEELKRKLSDMGYERAPLVEARGEFSIRGGIVDIFTADMDHPYRIELFDTEIDSIRAFDPDTQRSILNLKSIEIYPAEQMLSDKGNFKRAAEKIEKEYDAYIRKLERDDTSTEQYERIQKLEGRKGQLLEFLESGSNVQYLENYIAYFYDEPEYLWDYMVSGDIFIDDPDRIEESLSQGARERKEDFEVMLERGLVVPKDFANFSDRNDFAKVYEKTKVTIFTPFQKVIKGVPHVDAAHHIQSRQPPAFNGRLDLLETELKRYVKDGYVVTIVCANQERANNIGDFLDRCDLKENVKTAIGSLTSGIEFSQEKVCYIWDGDIFVNQKFGKAKNKKKKVSGQAIKSFSDMKKGDYVVHENHGIGKFLGIQQLTVQNIKKDYLKIKYAGEDLLYVPVEQMDIIQKYVAGDHPTPKINKLSGSEWKKTKSKVKAAIANMAKELLELLAKRKLSKGYAFSPDTVWQKEFEDSFPFQETEDQLRCISEIKDDMEKEENMDRLLCGDVGFGKTEVAARAVFKCAADGKQAVILVPTTILANQHYYTLKERFERFPFKVEMLSRFRSNAQQSEIIKKIKNGSIDVIIGTHRILSSDVQFKDLGLLVIDEEQRFGVRHKEKIKRLKKNVDILTLSATPIPRTLHMSLVGIRDMSLIEEPPEERYPVQTYVVEQEDELITEAIERELARGGQVYVVYNRVMSIHKIANKIERLVPFAKVAVGHGQMNERVLEDIMLDFINGNSNVLVATTIIESGIDIPNVNTMIILDADRFGLSQLYQLRGRVGRSNKLAFAYLMYQKDKALAETAEKRLRAIKEFTEFGAGFKVAMRDLEIRGAGNLLGMEQHGHMMMIGYELYCKLVDDAVRALGGEIVNPNKEESSVELPVTAYIPDRYISDEILKLQMYKKIAQVTSREEEEEIVDELIDRYGEIPKETENLIKVSRIRALAVRLCIMRIHEQAGKIIFVFAQENGLTAQVLVKLSESYGMRVFIHGGVKPFIRYTVKGPDKLNETIAFLERMAQFVAS